MLVQQTKPLSLFQVGMAAWMMDGIVDSNEQIGDHDERAPNAGYKRNVSAGQQPCGQNEKNRSQQEIEAEMYSPNKPILQNRTGDLWNTGKETNPKWPPARYVS
jgi:hypothetical protein